VAVSHFLDRQLKKMPGNHQVFSKRALEKNIKKTFSSRQRSFGWVIKEDVWQP
jgi:hypothetical protein